MFKNETSKVMIYGYVLPMHKVAYESSQILRTFFPQAIIRRFSRLADLISFLILTLLAKLRARLGKVFPNF